MIFIRMFFNLIFWLGIRFLFILFAFLSLFLPRPVFYRLARRALRGLFWCTLVRIRIRGLERLSPDMPLLFISDRPRRLFPLYLIAAFPFPIRFVTAEGILRVPFVGRVSRALGAISYPRDEGDRKKTWGFASSLYSSLRAREAVLIFYENLQGRSRHRAERRKRVVEISRSCGAEIVPMISATRGIGNGRNRDIFLLGRVEIEVREPFRAQAGENPSIMADRIRDLFTSPDTHQ